FRRRNRLEPSPEGYFPVPKHRLTSQVTRARSGQGHFSQLTNISPSAEPLNLAGIFWKKEPSSVAPVANLSQPSSPDIMTQPPPVPHLTPQFCFSTGTLRDFLRLSRASIDDAITQNLNALVTPSRAGFDPSSTSQRTPRALSRQIDPQSCQNFKDQALFPTWHARAEVLHYCGVVATSPDPDDPEALLLQIEKAKDKERVVDERLDPYSGRFFPREPRTERLAMLIRQEKGVENIVRTRTWDMVKQRCGESADTWEEAFEGWRRRTGVKGDN
ncbi:caffeine-induced death protein 2, partial [Colletotrichum truncatum]